MTEPTVPEETAPVTEEPLVAEPVAEEESATVEEVSDAELRSWAKENGIEGVPASGKLSAAWREQITAAMAAALDPKEEASVEEPSLESTTSTETDSTDQESPESTDEETPEEPATEYVKPWKPPASWVSGQVYTA